MHPLDSPAQPISYRSGPVEVRLATREFFRHGIRMPVQPKVFDLIVFLIEQRARVVDKDELQDVIWPRQVITEAALTRAIMKARKALDDDAERQRMIRTVHGRGYRFVAPVEVLTPSPAPESAMPAPASTAPMSTDIVAAPAQASAARWLALTASLVLLAASLVWLWRGERANELAFAPGEIRVAVLPVRNRTGDVSRDWMQLGLMSAVTQVLSVGGNLPTVSAGSILDVFPAGSDDSALPAALVLLRERFRASHVVSAELHPGQGNFRLTYRVIGPDGRERRRSLIGADIEALARGMGADLLILLDRRSLARVSMDDFVNETYLRGRALRVQGDLNEADALFRLASEQAPDAFWPRYEYALTRRDLGDREVANTLLRELLDQARSTGNAAELRAAANSLAIARMHDGVLDESTALLDEALVAARMLGDAEAVGTVLTNLSIVARRRGDLVAARRAAEDALETYEQAGLVHPSGNLLNTLGQIAQSEGRLGDAKAFVQRAVDAFRLVGDRRGEAVTLGSLASLLRREGDLANAAVLGEQVVALHRDTGERRGLISALLGLSSVAQSGGNLDLAEVHARAAQEAAEALGDQPFRADSRRRMAEIALDREEFPRVREELAAAMDIYVQAGEWSNVQFARLILAATERADGQFETAAALARDVLEWAERESDARMTARGHHALALTCLGTGDAATALHHAEAAIELASGTDDPITRASLQAARARALIALARFEEAAEALATAGDIPHQSTLLEAAAELSLAQGDPVAALAHLNEARSRAGQRWKTQDQARLEAVERAASTIETTDSRG